jgi:hypothetical protein
MEDNKAVNKLIDALESNDAKITFGLQTWQIEVIEKELERFGNREINAKYVKYIWEKLGKELAWCPFTLALYYFEYIDNKNKI